MNRITGSVVVCGDCGLAHRWPGLVPGAVARCTRCEAVIGRGHRQAISTILALTITAAVALLVGVTGDVLILQLGNLDVGATLVDSIRVIWDEGQPIVAVAAAATAIVAPALFIGLRLAILLPLAAGRKPPWFAWSIRLLHHADRWNMVQVFAIGTLLSLVRITAIADAVPGIGLYSLGLLMVLISAIEASGLQHFWWRLR